MTGIGNTGTATTYTIDKLLDNDGFKLEAGKTKDNTKAKGYFTDAKITAAATELAADLGVAGDTGVVDGLKTLITTRVNASTTTATTTVGEFLTDALADIKTKAGTDGIISTSELTTNSTETVAGNTSVEESYDDPNNKMLSLLLLQPFEINEQGMPFGTIPANGSNIRAAVQMYMVQTAGAALPANQAEALIQHFAAYDGITGLNDGDPNNLSPSEIGNLYKALVLLKDKVKEDDNKQLTDTEFVEFIKDFDEQDEGKKRTEEALQKLGDQSQNLGKMMKDQMSSIASKMTATRGQFKDQTAFQSPF